MLDYLLKDLLRTTKIHLNKLEKMGLTTARDLLEYFPRAIESSDIQSNLQAIRLDEKNTLSGKLHNIRKQKTNNGKTITKAAFVLGDDTVVEVVWFRVPYALKNFQEGKNVILVGKVTRNYGSLQLSNPELHLNTSIHVGGMRAIYPESPPITSKWLREKIAELLTLSFEFRETLPSQILSAESFMSPSVAIQEMHQPSSMTAWKEARERLAFEEIFEIQLRVLQQKIRRAENTVNFYPVPFEAEPVKTDLSFIPFELTGAQKKTLFQILKDLEKDRPSHRLVQGDVGSGKTIVAFLAAAAMVRAGYQVAILAPTEILAQQHFVKAVEFFDRPQPIKKSTRIDNSDSLTSALKNGIQTNLLDTRPNHDQKIPRVELLTGSITAKNKRLIKQDLANGSIDVLIGTHAILTEDTVFKHLGLAVIDEQHRFGVAQRNILAENHAHVVAMTATPIPRTLALTIYGDQDLSVIDELPAGRKTIITRVIAGDKKEQQMNLFLDDQIEKKHQVFWVCPLVEESEAIEAKNVLQEYERIKQVFGNRRVDYLHGKMKPKEKENIMQRFKAHDFDILVSTSVIEVGVDIPNATVMVIENSERFGLSQLHQFRGRIGRNDRQSYCFLRVGKSEDTHKERLKAMERHHQGQKLAEIDLELRGMGSLYGTKQSGLPDFKVADITNIPLLEKAKDWAQKILLEDVELVNYPALRKKINQQVVYF